MFQNERFYVMLIDERIDFTNIAIHIHQSLNTLFFEVGSPTKDELLDLGDNQITIIHCFDRSIEQPDNIVSKRLVLAQL